MRVPFNRPAGGPLELEAIAKAVETRQLGGPGSFAAACTDWLQKEIGCRHSLLTTSATTAMEMQAYLLDIAPGDEVIMPSFTFVTTATAFVIRGATPVFVDVRPDTLNLDETKVEAAITPRTRAIMAVHYAGVGCNMDALADIARRHGLVLLEDAAHAVLSTYKGKPLGSFGALAALSFHETKNLHCGEGGALLINDPQYAPRARIIAEKGTNRTAFLDGLVDKYTWVDLGSSCQPSELNSAFLLAQFERADELHAPRRKVWDAYHAAFEPYEARGWIRRPVVPADCEHNAHIYYLLLEREDERSAFIAGLKEYGIGAVFHYIPLHSSPAGRKFGRSLGSMAVTDAAGKGLVRLPLWPGVEEHVDYVVDCTAKVLTSIFAERPIRARAARAS